MLLWGFLIGLVIWALATFLFLVPCAQPGTGNRARRSERRRSGRSG